MRLTKHGEVMFCEVCNCDRYHRILWLVNVPNTIGYFCGKCGMQVGSPDAGAAKARREWAEARRDVNASEPHTRGGGS